MAILCILLGTTITQALEQRKNVDKRKMQVVTGVQSHKSKLRILGVTLTLSMGGTKSIGLLLLLMLMLPLAEARLANDHGCLIMDENVVDCSQKGLTFVPRSLPPTTKIL